MRYNIISLGCAFAAAVCISCSKDNVAELPLQTFRAESPDTRTTLSGTSILWMPSDEISLYKGIKGEGTLFSTSITEPSASADFTGKGAVKLNDKYYAFYPASAHPSGRGWSDKYVYFQIPQKQTAVNGQLPESCNIMAASSEGTNFAFRHYAAFIKFSFDGSSPAIKSITVSADGAKISGTFRVTLETMSSGTYNLSGAVNYDNVCLATSDGNAFGEGSYYLALRGMKYSNGVSFTFVRTDGKVAVKKIVGECSLSDGDLMDMGTVRLAESDFVDPMSKIGTAYKSGNDKGVVFWVNPNNPVEGKIVSVWTSSEKLLFVKPASASTPAISALDVKGQKDEDGSVNVAKFKASDQYKGGKYIWALDECENEANGFQDGGWYLPSSKELRLIIGAVHGLTFEKSLTLAHKEKFSSTEASRTRFVEAVKTCDSENTSTFLGESLWSSETVTDGTKVTYVKLNSPDNEGNVTFSQMNNDLTNTLKMRCVKKVRITY